MSLTAIPIEFEKYLQNKISVGLAPDMNEMIFAYLPDLDLETAIDRTNGLPDITYWVHQQDIDQVGKLGDNALVYSVVIPGSVAAFTFNAIYLRDKNTTNSCGMVVYKADETKEPGMASTKSLVQQYTGAAQIAGITVDAATWQIDYQARLLGIEDDIRLAWLDYYGHSTFITGYDVIQQADPTKFKITAGTAYIGGLRAVLENDVIQTLSTLPTAFYLDVVREGTVLSVWSNLVSVVASETAFSDYVDENNQQHYVAKIADIAADGTVSINKTLSEMEEHLQTDDPHPQYALKDEFETEAGRSDEIIKIITQNSNAKIYPELSGGYASIDGDFTSPAAATHLIVSMDDGLKLVEIKDGPVTGTITALDTTIFPMKVIINEVSHDLYLVDLTSIQSQLLGVNQSWQHAELTDTGKLFDDGTPSYRTFGVTYSNDKISSKVVNVYATASTGTEVLKLRVSIDGEENITFGSNSSTSGGQHTQGQILIPAYSDYVITPSVTATLSEWEELI